MDQLRRWRRWAHALVSRYRRRTAQVPPAGIVLWSSRDGHRPYLAVHRGWQVHLAVHPRLSWPTRRDRIGGTVFVVRRAVAPAPGVRAPRSAAAGVPRVAAVVASGTGSTGWRGARPPSGEPGAARIATRYRRVAPPTPPAVPRHASNSGATGVVVPACRHTAQRVVQRGRRVESHAVPVLRPSDAGRAPTAALGPTAAPRRSAQPPMAVLRRNHGSVTERQPMAPASGADHPQWTDGQPRAERIDIGQLADQVVRRIDERIIAHRERLGRI